MTTNPSATLFVFFLFSLLPLMLFDPTAFCSTVHVVVVYLLQRGGDRLRFRQRTPWHIRMWQSKGHGPGQHP